MNRPATAREALIAELIGDVANLLTRVESFTSTMDQAREAMAEAADGVVASVEPFRAQIDAISERAKVKAVEHIARHTHEMARQLQARQREAMAQAAQAILSKEIAPALQRLIVSLERTVQRSNRAYEVWLTHAATAVLSAACSAVLLLQLIGR
jgi:uncharacterized protein (DUF885 family)